MNGNKLTEKEAIEMIAQSYPLGNVYKCMVSGEFVPAPQEEVAKNETVIGELTPLEKAIMTVVNEIADKNNEIMARWLMEDAEVDPVQCETNKVIVNSLGELFWVLIRCRLGAAAYGGGGIGIRREYKIVSIKKRREPDGQSLRELACMLYSFN